jgi:FixJ family two-component response regulator
MAAQPRTSNNDRGVVVTHIPLVVVVEDDAGSRRSLARVLRAGGFEPATYASAEEFLAAPPAHLPVGMLLDVRLPALSGLDLQKQLRREGSTIPIIIMTALEDAASREEAERYGCLAYLNKPCDGDRILTLLQGLVDR